MFFTSVSEPSPVQVSAHHGVLHHHPPRDPHSVHDREHLHLDPPVPLSVSSGTLRNTAINDNAQPTGHFIESTATTLTTTPSFSSANSVISTLNKNSTETETPSLPLPPTTPINPSTMIVDDLFSSAALPSFDWDQFLVADADRAAVEAVTALDKEEPATSQVNTPASEADTPKSTESESSATLEVGDIFNFDLDSLPTGITHDPSDLLSSLSAPAVPDVTLATDPTILSTFGSSFGADLGSLAAIGNDPVASLQLDNILSQLTAAPTPSVTATPAAATPNLPEAYAALGWPLSNTKTPASSMASPALSSLAMKRKGSDSSDDMSSAKRPRGRPPSSTPVAKRPYRRQSKNGLSLSQLAAAAASGKPVVVDVKPPIPDEAEEAASPVRLTSTGKPSTARPKAVVPEKYMKNGEAQAITGMTTEQILSFPNWSALMECVDDAHRAGAEVFGKMITENRDKAKWAAKKSRDERKAKVETLEGQVDELQGKIAEMRGLLLGLVGRGLVPLSEVESFI